MNTGYRWESALALAALVALLSGCGGGETKEAEAAEAADAAPQRTVSVEVQEVARAPFTDYVQVVGTVEANRDVTVSAEEAGVVRELLVEKGSFVKAGQPIARIDDRLLRAQAEQATAQAKLAAETFERQRRLWEEDKIGTEMAYLNARYGAETAAAGARVLRERLERSVVRAPIPGILEDRMVEVGSMVSPGAPVARIVDLSAVKISGGVPERYASQVQRGGEVQIAFDALGGQAFTGQIHFVGASVESRSRTFPVEVRVPNPSASIKPGMVAAVRIARATAESALVVPQQAVLRDEGGYIVYVAAEKDGATVAEARPVVPGPSQGNQILIESGLEAGDRVIVVGQQNVARGDRLKIVGR